MSEQNQETTHFGYQTVPAAEKARKVRGVFDSVSDNYDLMNDLMSMGVHRLWKRYAVSVGGFRKGESVLDLAGGTGDLAALIAPRIDAGKSGSFVLSDINASMLSQGRDRMTDRGLLNALRFVQANAECLPFADASFDAVTMAFGLRNVTDKQAAIASIYRVLKPGGRILVLEFSKPVSSTLSKIYDAYSFSVLPRLGKAVANDEESYRYLAESIRMHPDQETLAGMMRSAGFDRCQYYNLTGGIVALHRGWKL